MLPAWGRSFVLPMTQPIDGCPSHAASQRSGCDTSERKRRRAQAFASPLQRVDRSNAWRTLNASPRPSCAAPQHRRT
jgi:hypothetical protein